MNTRWLMLVLALAVLFGATACGAAKQPEAAPQEGQTQGGPAENGQEPTEKDGDQTVYPLTVTDASGLEMTFEAEPRRIVSIAPSETEVLFAIGAGDRVVGVDKNSNYPAEAAEKPEVGGLEANVEKILELNPDLVVAGWTMSTKTVEELRKLGLRVYTFETKSVDGAISHIREVGRIMNLNAEAGEVVARMEAQRKLVANATAGLTDAEKKTVYLEFAPGWTVGKGVFLDELITIAGGINIADGDGWYEISEENIIAANPDVILYAAGVEGLKETILGRSGWSKIQAVEEGMVHGLDDDVISRPGPRITTGLLEVAKALYPEKF